MVLEQFSPSPLSHFDPADLLDVLSTGVVVLDGHLCVVYANVGAQDLLAVGLNKGRGRPITEIPLERSVVVYCACPNDATAVKVALLLRRSGIRQVRPLAGGIDAWSAASR